MRASVCMRARVRVRVCACRRARACARARPNGGAARRGPRRGWEQTPQPCVRRRQSRNPRPRSRHRRAHIYRGRHAQTHARAHTHREDRGTPATYPEASTATGQGTRTADPNTARGPRNPPRSPLFASLFLSRHGRVAGVHTPSRVRSFLQPQNEARLNFDHSFLPPGLAAAGEAAV